MSEQEEVLGLIEDALSGDVNDNAEGRVGALNEIAAMVRSGQILVAGSSPLKVANDLVAAADTSDWENCEVCAELEETCVVCASVTLGHAQVVELLQFVLHDTERAWGWMDDSLRSRVKHKLRRTAELVRVGETFTWDGTPESYEAICKALPGRVHGGHGVPLLYLKHPDTYSARIGEGWRIRVEGDSFAVLPPAQEDAE